MAKATEKATATAAEPENKRKIGKTEQAMIDKGKTPIVRKDQLDAELEKISTFDELKEKYSNYGFNGNWQSKFSIALQEKFPENAAEIKKMFKTSKQSGKRQNIGQKLDKLAKDFSEALSALPDFKRNELLKPILKQIETAKEFEGYIAEKAKNAQITNEKAQSDQKLADMAKKYGLGAPTEDNAQ